MGYDKLLVNDKERVNKHWKTYEEDASMLHSQLLGFESGCNPFS